jgi:Xaa-Pro aminopeptidase
MEARSGSSSIEAGDLVHFDTGAEYNYYSADVQRVVPADGTFTEKQRRIYVKVAEVQETVIRNVKPGATWWELHNLAVKMLKEAGGWDESYTYGIGHFIGMDVHEHGDYLAPYQPGMVLAIEQGVVVDGIRVAFEDDVLVTTDGYEWLTEFIPIRADDVEKLRREPVQLEPEKLLLEPR